MSLQRHLREGKPFGPGQEECLCQRAPGLPHWDRAGQGRRDAVLMTFILIRSVGLAEFKISTPEDMVDRKALRKSVGLKKGLFWDIPALTAHQRSEGWCHF